MPETKTPLRVTPDVVPNPLQTPIEYYGAAFNGTNFVYQTNSDLVNLTIDSDETLIGSIRQVASSPVVISDRFVGIHLGGGLTLDGDTLTPGMKAGTVRINTSFCAWPDIDVNGSEASYRASSVSLLDQIMAYADSIGADVIYTLSGTNYYLGGPYVNGVPAYCATGGVSTKIPTSNVAVTAYLTWLMTRYAGVLTAVEIWNEPNLNGFYTGTTGELITYGGWVYDAVQTINTALSTSVLVVSPSYTDMAGVSAFSAYLSGGGADKCDVVGCHPYLGNTYLTCNMATVDAYMASASANAPGQPVWMTEVGDSAPTAEVVERMLLYIAAKGAARCCWWHWSGRGVGDMSIRRGMGLEAWNGIHDRLSGSTLSFLNRRGQTVAGVLNGAEFII